jgi:hypothetical protein
MFWADSFFQTSRTANYTFFLLLLLLLLLLLSLLLLGKCYTVKRKRPVYKHRQGTPLYTHIRWSFYELILEQVKPITFYRLPQYRNFPLSRILSVSLTSKVFFYFLSYCNMFDQYGRNFFISYVCIFTEQLKCVKG